MLSIAMCFGVKKAWFSAPLPSLSNLSLSPSLPLSDTRAYAQGAIDSPKRERKRERDGGEI